MNRIPVDILSDINRAIEFLTDGDPDHALSVLKGITVKDKHAKETSYAWTFRAATLDYILNVAKHEYRIARWRTAWQVYYDGQPMATYLTHREARAVCIAHHEKKVAAFGQESLVWEPTT